MADIGSGTIARVCGYSNERKVIGACVSSLRQSKDGIGVFQNEDDIVRSSMMAYAALSLCKETPRDVTSVPSPAAI